MLLAHATELFLKVAYLVNGGEPSSLGFGKGKIGHDLVSVLEAATALGFRPRDPAIHLLAEQLNTLHTENWLRYGEKMPASSTVFMPSAEEQITLLKRLGVQLGSDEPRLLED